MCPRLEQASQEGGGAVRLKTVGQSKIAKFMKFKFKSPVKVRLIRIKIPEV